MSMVDLRNYSNDDYQIAPFGIRFVWLVISRLFFETWFPWPNRLKRVILRTFKGQVGRGVVVKPHVKIKYPWLLAIGDNSWIGEHVWIDNLARVTIKDNAVLSQGAFLLTGNHNYHSPDFDLEVSPIEIGSGAWIAAKAIVCPGVIISDYAVLSVASLATSNLSELGIYSGSPCKFVRLRRLSTGS